MEKSMARNLCTMVLLILTGSILLSASLEGQPLPDRGLHEKILQGIDLTLKQEYPAARQLFRSLTQEYPNHPAGYLYLAGAVQAEFSDYEQSFEQKLFDSLLAKGETLADRLIEGKDSAAWGYYYAGTALSYRAFSASERGNWPSVIIDGMNSAKMFGRCLELNPQFYDAMEGLGTYYYWRSKKTEFLSWVPFVTNRKQEGISLLHSAVDHGTYERYLGLNSLILVLTEEERYDEALQLTTNALSEYPQNRSFLWCLVGIEERSPHHDTVALKSAVSRLLTSILKAPVRNCYYEAACRLKLAQYAFDERRYDDSIEECTMILQYRNLDGKTKRDIGKKIRGAEELLEKAKKMATVNSQQ